MARKSGIEAIHIPTHIVKQGFTLKENGIEAVSYTHLRAHETDSYLVCRLLLEKKKKTVYYTHLTLPMKKMTTMGKRITADNYT